ncbi:MAG: phosphate/phosphite/phosphonate ABC transporter substrate-binding protein [Syntrophales bacterium]|nr:phosphate/phosphite/phosphonate ABC transporter substrate-binding protein [Syntrophales bacterium]
MKSLRMSVIVVAILLYCMAALSCQQGEEAQKVNLDKKTANLSQLRKDTGKIKSLVFCFDLRLSPEEDAQIYGSFLDYLEKETGLDFDLLFSKDYKETIDNIGTGKAQFAIIGGLSYLKAEHDYGVRMLVKGLDEKGKGNYRAAIIVKKTSPLNQLSQLKGRTFAFGSKYSTQGHLIPRYMLEREGISLTDLKKHLFVGSHWACAKAVIRGDVSAGGVQDRLALDLEKQGDVKILAISDYYSRSGIAVNKDVAEETASKVKTALLQFEPLGKDKEGLINWSKTEMPGGFTAVQPGDYDVLKKLAARYQLLGDE